MIRTDFSQPSSSLQDELLKCWEDEQLAPTDFSLLRASRAAMATLFEVVIPFGTPHGGEAASAALDLVDELEDQLTVYREQSEICSLNRRAAFEDVAVESRLFDLLAFAGQLTRETQGAFDIATGALIKSWGFHKRQGRVPSVAERSEAMWCTGMRHVIVNSERRTIRYLRKGLEINLGAIGKGYALDRAAELLRKNWDIGSALIHGGASSVLAIGAPPGQPVGWTVSLRHPWNEGRSIGAVKLRDRALGTSAATYQHFEYNGRKLGHLLDPRKGWPAEGLQQVSAIAPTAAEADALSTAFFVMGLEATRDYCRMHPTIGAVILPEGENAAPVTLNLTPGAFTLSLSAVHSAGS
jgi:thiamine biosynthesis lipoprotein